MRKLIKPVSILLSVFMIFSVFSTVPFSAAAAVTYVERTWDAGEKQIVETSETTTDYTALSSSITTLNSGTYVLNDDVTYSKRLNVASGANAEIILVNGKTLKNDKGIIVPANATLTIYGQAADGDDVKADSGVIDAYNPDGAAIGAMDEEKTGSIIIKGGTVKATGGKKDAGIGTGKNHSSGFEEIAIYGGNVTAQGGEMGAGIGAGRANTSANGKMINIYGGTIKATGGDYGAGIGGGEDSHGENITISGGEVHACSRDGAGIGGGEDGKQGTIKITGGTVKCISQCGAGIGGGSEEHTKGSITIDGGSVFAVSSYGAGIGSGYWSDMESPITINGGSVYARSGVDYDVSFSDLTAVKFMILDSVWGSSGAGIGAGDAGSQDGTITINDGTVMAFGGGAGLAYGFGGGAGIGGGREYGSSSLGIPLEGVIEDVGDFGKDVICDIFGKDRTPHSGDGGEGDKVVINGGYVVAWGDSEASAIGYGQGGSSLSDDDLELPDNYSVTYLDMEVSLKDIVKLIKGKKSITDILSELANSIKFANKEKRQQRCQKEGQLVILSPCQHLNKEYTLSKAQPELYHLVDCKNCYDLGYSSMQRHEGNPCELCGYAGVKSRVLLFYADKDQAEEYFVATGEKFTLPEAPDAEVDGKYLTANGWYDEAQGPNSTIYEAGESVTINGDTSFCVNYVSSYPITVDDSIEHGTLSTGVTSALQGDTITVEYKADEDYKVDTITVDGDAIEPDDDGKYTFTMPNHQVTVSGTFVQKDHEHYDADTEELVMTFGYYSTQGGGVITENKNYFLADDEQTMRSISGNTTVNLCLKGHKLSIPNSLIVNNGATLNIYDCTGEGFITGGSIYVLNGGTLNFYGASIKGNTNASGVIIAQGGTFNMYAGSIKENTYESMVGGVYVSSGAQFNILGDVTIQSNYVINGDQTIDNNVYLEEGAKINIGAELTDKTRIGVSVKDNTQIPYVLTDGLNGKGSTANFSSDNSEFFIEKNTNGEAQINRPYRLSFNANGGTGTMDTETVDGDSLYLPGCDFTAPAGKRFYGWKIGDKVYMESARVTISGDTTAYAQWTDQLYNVWLDGHRVTVENKDDILGNGTASYDPSTNTLTLTNANIEMSEYKSGLSCGIRYNESSDKAFTIVLNGTNTIKDDIADRNIDEKYGILQFGAAPSYTISGGGTLNIGMNAVDEDVTYYGIHTRKSITVDGSTVSVNIPGTEKTTGVDMIYTYSYLKLQNSSQMTIQTGSNEQSYALASNEASTLGSGGSHLYVEDPGSKFTAESGNKAFNENITLSDETLSRGAYIKDKVDSGLSKWDGNADLKNYSYVAIPGENTFAAHLVGHSISLDGSIGVNFYMELSDDVVAHQDTAKMHFTIPKNGDPGVQEVLVKDAGTKVVGGKTYYTFTCNVAAKEIESDIKAQLIDGDNESALYTYSVRQYADYLIEHQNDKQTFKDAVSLVEAMMTYGENAMYYFDKAGDEPAAINAEIPEYTSTVYDLPEGVTFGGATLSLKSETTLSLYFNSAAEPTLTCADTGVTYETDKTGENEYVIRIRGIAAYDLNKTFTVNVNGTKAVEYSALTYCYKAQNNSNTKLANTVKALYLYWVEADEYFAPVHVHTEATKQENVVAATCTTAGGYDIVTYCTGCNEELGREHVDIPATGHTIVFVEEVPATHEESGTAAHYECSVCHKLFSNAEGTTQTNAAALAIPRIKNVDLSALTDDITLLDGDIVTGTLGGDYKITIADGASITLKNADITCLSNDAEYAGITPLGNATILLKGMNTVKGGYEDYPGINSAENHTLTIDGTGSLTASSGGRYYGCGIGGGRMIPAGNIVINGGNITAYGGNSSAGIGSGNGIDGRCGNITINGGTVTATGAITNDATSNGAGIGCGTGGTCGDITINGGTVTATGGDNASAIGSANNGTCGDITIAATITKVTAGDIINSIGKPNFGTCGTVSIAEGLSDTTTEVRIPGELYSKFIRVIVPAPHTVDLTTLSGTYEAQHGDVLTGNLTEHCKITIAAGATVTLNNANITCLDENDEFAGITPLGNATIILKGNNTVKGGNDEYPGIYVPENATLTIDGDGSLTASSNGYGCGIGAGMDGQHEINAGNIIINGGTITANGGTNAAGIGSSNNSSCGDISIFGGTVIAKGGSRAAGIGSGYWGDCGDITIADTVTSVTATKGNSAPNSIGKGQNGTCGTVTIESGANVIQN